MKKESSKESHQRKKPLDFRTRSPKILRMVSAVTAERLLLVTAKRSLPWNSSFLSHRQIKFTENTAFSRINACFSLCKPKKRLHPDRSGGSKAVTAKRSLPEDTLSSFSAFAEKRSGPFPLRFFLFTDSAKRILSFSFLGRKKIG